ncbi:MAG: sigma-70 family RNA polymerase sigma factor, partial [Planctomycetota bacterium]
AAMAANGDSMLGGDARFVTTRWSVVLGAAGPPEEDPGGALEVLCRTYWPAVYAYLRRHGHAREDARDLTQAFFARLVEGDWLARADSERGSFRAFLVTILRRFVANEAEREAALRRGGGAVRLPFAMDLGAEDGADGTALRGVPEPADGDDPEAAFERAWVRALLDRVLESLRAEYAGSGQADRFDHLEPHLVPGDEPPPFDEMAAALGLAVSSCRVAVFRARRRYRDLLRAEVAATLGGSEGVDDELDALLGALRVES